MSPPVHIRFAAAREVIDLRHAVLRAGLGRETAIFKGDEEAGTRHFVATSSGEVVGCVTLLPSTFEGRPAWQLRGMAVTPALQRSGVGAQLLKAVERFVASDPSRQLLWCNARVPASGFYQRHGWRIVSDVFEIPSAGPHVRMVRLCSPPVTPGEAG